MSLPFHVNCSRSDATRIGHCGRWARRGLLVAGIIGLTAAGKMIVTNFSVVATLHSPVAEHIDQTDLLTQIQQGQGAAAFDEAFEVGDEMFETRFNSLDGGGANVGDGQRYTRMPRADLLAPGQWAAHVPARATGPNAETCANCHNRPVTDGAGGPEANVHRDPLHTGDIRRMIQRNTPPTFALGALQRLAEEMTVTLQGIRTQLAASVRASNRPASVPLVAKGVDFGVLRAVPAQGRPGGIQFDNRQVAGVDADLVVKPFQWKGSERFVRDFVRGAGHNELGMQAVELIGVGVDGDGDGVANELSVGDITALTVYQAAQPRPVTKIELASLGLIPALDQAVVDAIGRGSSAFDAVGCAACHKHSLVLDDPVFREPSAHPSYRDTLFPSGADPASLGLRSDFPLTIDLSDNHVENVIVVNGQEVRLGSLPHVAGSTAAVVELLGDLKRHDMGPGLAERIDEVGTGASVFMTENLWGVGSSAPYLHDGRATTLTEAILEHGGEAAAARSAFLALPTAAQTDLIAFLDNQVLFKQ
jgi:mono/diheme cytochrome c family protein